MKKILTIAIAVMLSACSAILTEPYCGINYKYEKIQTHKVKKSELAAVVHFADGSSELNSTDRKKIKLAAQRALAEEARIVVYGHASHRTKTKDVIQRILVNLQISDERALRVAAALAEDGVDFNTINTIALFDSRPVKQEKTRADEAANRRAEIYLYWLE